jgi:glycosyltransferase involved in cell wall biosynthesis
MRLTYVGAVPPLQGGIAQHGARLISALRVRGHDVRIISWRSQYPAALYPGKRQIDPDADPLEGARFVLQWWNPGSWVMAGRETRRWRPDAVVIPWVTPLQAPALRVLTASAGSPRAVVVVHNYTPHEQQPFTHTLTRWFFRRVPSSATVHSTEGQAHLGRIAPDLPTVVVPHPPNVEIAPTDLPQDDGPCRLIFLGFVRPYKGVEVLLRAVRLLLDRGVEVSLTVAGQVWGDEGALVSQIEELGLTGDVILRNAYIPDAELNDLLASHHALVAPYLHATQSGVIPLALAAGRPVVATRVGGLAEQVREGEDSVLVEPGDASALADGIAEVLADLPRRARSARRSGGDWVDVAAAVEELAGGG